MKATFKTLEAWKKGRELQKRISKLTKSFPPEDKYKLTDQIIRSSRSVTANIAEGYGRFHYQGHAQFCRTARGSLFETIDHLTVAQDEEYIDEAQFENLRSEVLEVVKILNGYIKYLLDQK
ncbi:MAG: four helix bundle protein [Bacteroidales bacterium]|nr:four helix bundle protein [Bacteroidales bacterium]MCF8455306.1 four helix bundle protein [Bacteroidales bacterium]